MLGRALTAGLVLSLLAAILAVGGVLRADLDATPPRPDPQAPPPEFRHVGPIMDLTGPSPRSVHLPPRTVALTFDDGPDARGTPAILEVLRRHHVPATFFTVGSAVVDHPDIARRIVEDGHELGVHGFSHRELSAMSDLRFRT
ncbi:MAG: polysaccharide deacetylase family protein, partial [Actinomycetota bacterium]|nr:polysaccharide deacetylase family protein [Actinomycetota bacterium]